MYSSGTVLHVLAASFLPKLEGKGQAAFNGEIFYDIQLFNQILN